MYNHFYTNTAPRYGMSEPSSFPSSTIQTLQGVQPQVQCFFVSAPTDISNIQITPGTVYIGINKSTKEIYTRQWNLDGNIDFETYRLHTGTQEEPEYKAILAKLDTLIAQTKESSRESVSANHVTGNVGPMAEQSHGTNDTANDAGQNAPAAV